MLPCGQQCDIVNLVEANLAQLVPVRVLARVSDLRMKGVWNGDVDACYDDVRCFLRSVSFLSLLSHSCLIVGFNIF